jgi:hypothetical protein
VAKFTGSTSIGNSNITDNGSSAIELNASHSNSYRSYIWNDVFVYNTVNFTDASYSVQSRIYGNANTLYLQSNNGSGTFKGMTINSSWNAIFDGSISAGNSTFANGSGSSQITIGQTSTGYSSIKFAIDSTKYSWLIGGQYNVDQGFEITPSSTVGGSTFNTPVFKILSSGAATFPGSVTVANALSLTSSNSPYSTSAIIYALSGYNIFFGPNGQWSTQYFGQKTDGTFYVNGGAATFSSTVQSTQFRSLIDGSDTILGAGHYWANAANTRAFNTQLSADGNSLKTFGYDGSSWSSVIYTLSNTGAATFANYVSANAPFYNPGATYGTQAAFVSNWPGPGVWGIGGNTSGNIIRIDQCNNSPTSPTWAGQSNMQLMIGTNMVLSSNNYTTYAPSLTGSGASGTWAISISGNASSATTWNGLNFNGLSSANRSGADLNTLGLVGTSGIYNLSNNSNAPASSLYGTLYAIWNGDISTQLYVSYNGYVYWRKSNGTSYSGQPWYTFLDSSNYSSYALPLSGGTMTGQVVFSSTAAPFSFQNNGNTGTYTQTTFYANQNNTSGDTLNGIFIERGFTDTSNTEIRHFIIGSRGGGIQWKLTGSGASYQTNTAEVKSTGEGSEMFIGRYSAGSARLFRVYQASGDGYLEMRTGADAVVTKLSGYAGTLGYTLAPFAIGQSSQSSSAPLSVYGPTIAANFATNQNGAGSGLCAYFVNQNGSGYSSWIYIGSGPGTDWKIGKNISNPTNTTYHFEIVDSSNNLRLQINNGTGNATFSSDIIAYSDIRFKKNIRTISNPLERVLKCNGILYDRTDTTEKNTFGFVAQELEEVFPELVTTDDNGIKGVKYQNATAILFEAIKEQQSQIEELKAQIAYLVENR